LTVRNRAVADKQGWEIQDMDLFAAETMPFAVAIGLTLAIALIEVVTLLAGLSASEAVDGALPDLHAEPSDVDVPALSQVLGWLSFGRLPALVVVIIATTSFGLSGFIVQELMIRAFGFALQPGIASIPAAIATLFSMHHVGHWLGRLMPREETEAVSTSEFIGRVATVFRGTARPGQPAEAKLTDIHGKTHYVLVEPEETDLALAEGSEVVLIRQSGPIYQAIIRLKPVE
jgi:hypothetical protein